MPKNLTRKKNGIYWTDFMAGGRRIRRSLYTGNLSAAKALLEKVKEEERITARFGRDGHSWAETCLHWSRDYLASAVEPGTAARYRISIRQLTPFFKAYPIALISKAEIGNFVAARQGMKASNATIKRDLSVLNMILFYASSRHWRDGSPVLEYLREARLREKAYEVVIPKPDEYRAFLAKLSPSFGACVRLLQETGMRQSEAVMLRWDDIDFTRLEITLTAKRTKTKRYRLFSIEPETAQWLMALPRHRTAPYVFWHGAEGSPYRNFASRFRALNKHPWRCHDLRHWFAVRKIQEGWDLYRLSRHLGHSSVKVTEGRYLAWIRQEESRRARERIADIA